MTKFNKQQPKSGSVLKDKRFPSFEERDFIRQLILQAPKSWGLEYGVAWSLEEGLEHLIELISCLTSLERHVLSKRNKDFVDTDFHTDNNIQKVITFSSGLSMGSNLSTVYHDKLREFFELVLEGACSLHLDLKHTVGKEISVNTQRYMDEIKSYLRKGLDPTSPKVLINNQGWVMEPEDTIKISDVPTRKGKIKVEIEYSYPEPLIRKRSEKQVIFNILKQVNRITGFRPKQFVLWNDILGNPVVKYLDDVDSSEE